MKPKNCQICQKRFERVPEGAKFYSDDTYAGFHWECCGSFMLTQVRFHVNGAGTVAQVSDDHPKYATAFWNRPAAVDYALLVLSTKVAKLEKQAEEGKLNLLAADGQVVHVFHVEPKGGFYYPEEALYASGAPVASSVKSTLALAYPDALKGFYEQMRASEGVS